MPTPTPTPTPVAVKPTTTTTRVPGAVITFQTPGTCVRPGTSFRVTLKWRRQKRKGNLFVKIRRTDFYIGTRRVAIDRRAPFVKTLRIANARPATTYVLRARAFIKVKRGRSPKKSIRARVRTC